MYIKSTYLRQTFDAKLDYLLSSFYIQLGHYCIGKHHSIKHAYMRLGLDAKMNYLLFHYQVQLRQFYMKSVIL